MNKFTVLLVAVSMVFVWLLFKAIKTKNNLKELVNSRDPISLADFISMFPEKNTSELETLFYRLQDMLTVNHDEYFPIEPEDEIYKTYHIHSTELAEMLNLISEECKIKKQNLENFLIQNKHPTVKDLVNLLGNTI